MPKPVSATPKKYDPVPAVAQHFPGWSPYCQVLMGGKPCGKPAKNWERRAGDSLMVSRCDKCFFAEMDARRITKKVPALPFLCGALGPLDNTTPIPIYEPKPKELFDE